MRFVIALVLGLAAGCVPVTSESTPPVGPDPVGGKLDIDWSKWSSVTQKPFRVGIDFATLCDAPNPERMKALKKIDKEKNGPHAETTIVVKVNPIGLEEFKSRKPVPVGTIVIKEKYSNYAPDTPPDAVAVMIKREAGYDTDHGDWEYAFEQRKPEKSLVRG
jgi:hypothetical protein